MIKEVDHNYTLNPIFLDENILVYRDVVSDIQDLYRIVRESEERKTGEYFLAKWDKWSKFGTYSQNKWNKEDIDSSKKGTIYDEEKYFADKVDFFYKICLKDYLDRTKIDLPESSWFGPPSYCKYDKDIDILDNNLTMQYHTDYIIGLKDVPGDKFYITCTMYINDDYDGGDIEFWIEGKKISWKPKAGDIVIFPSAEPYWHGVKVIENGEKFFVRKFVMYRYEGSPEWLSNRDKYGEDVWKEMEEKRIEYEMPRVMLYVDEKTNERISYEEVLARRHSGN